MDAAVLQSINFSVKSRMREIGLSFPVGASASKAVLSPLTCIERRIISTLCLLLTYIGLTNSFHRQCHLSANNHRTPSSISLTNSPQAATHLASEVSNE